MRKNRKTPVENRGTVRPTEGKGAARSTVSGPSKGAKGNSADPAVRKTRNTQTLAAAFPYNRNKPGEIGKASRAPKPGATAEPPDSAVTGSTLSEANTSAKTGAPAQAGLNPGNRPLDRVRVDSGGQVLTTNFAQPIADNQNSLKAGLRGPALWRTSSSARSSPISTTSASPSGSCTRADRRPMACSSATTP